MLSLVSTVVLSVFNVLPSVYGYAESRVFTVVLSVLYCYPTCSVFTIEMSVSDALLTVFIGILRIMYLQLCCVYF